MHNVVQACAIRSGVERVIHEQPYPQVRHHQKKITRKIVIVLLKLRHLEVVVELGLHL